METQHLTLEEKTLKMEKRISDFAKQVFNKEHQKFATDMQTTTEQCITKLKAEADGIKRTQLTAQERHTQAIIKQGIETLQQKIEKRQDETLDILDLKASELEELSRQTLDALPEYIQEELQYQITLMKTTAAAEIERHGKTVSLDVRQRMRQESIFDELKEDIRRSVGNNLKQNEQTIQADLKKNMSEFLDLVAQRKMEIKSVVSTHKMNIQSAAVTELKNFKEDIQLAAAALVAKAAETIPQQPTSNDESSADNEYPDNDNYDAQDYDQNTHDTHRGHPPTPQGPSRWINAKALITTSHLENFDNKVRITRSTTKLNSIDATQLYNYLSEKMSTNQLPINDIDDLTPRGSCIPTNAESEIGKETLQKISKVLYRKIHDKVGDDDQQIKAIVDNHSIERDGYKTLYDIMRHFQQHLQDIPMLWGPTWTETMSPREYVTQIKQQVRQESKSNNRTRTEQEQVIEMVLQSQKIGQYSSTTGALMMQLALHGQSDAFKNLELSQLATMFDNATPTTTSSITSTTPAPGKPIIKKFNASSERSNDRYTSREPREKVQCNLCKQFGHAQSKGQVCRDAAKIYWIVKDLGLLPQSGNQPSKNPQELAKQVDVYKANAKLYQTANEIYPKIKAMKTAQFEGLTMEEEMEIVYQLIGGTITEADTAPTQTQDNRREDDVSQDFL
jgi:hypothetical protein